MGNSNSNRKITVVNDEVAGVIKVSSSLVGIYTSISKFCFNFLDF